ncbi:MAG: phage/plasmid primase, P4 family [Lachnospiraceae bacterium]|nr:phage/plasmid primase, P4 family [Lachnospiraceae bacterium]MCM1230021.1 phage/plasmid primase, P4 family [Ruminococcus flavefaciens]
MFEKIPQEMKSCNNWVCWQGLPDEKSHSGIKKVPMSALNGSPAKSNDPTTWTNFGNALIGMKAGNFNGIGFMFSNSDYFGVDIDDCRDEVERYLNGDKSGIIGEFIETLGSYAEISQSGNGIHIICKGTLPEGARRKGKIEMYDKGRYFIMTGNQIGGYSDVADCTESIKNLHQKYLGTTQKKSSQKSDKTTQSLTEKEIVDRMCTSSIKAERLYKGDFSEYNSQSEADMAFCSILAFWCGGDTLLMDSVYRNSGLMRDKWDRKQSGSTYGKLLLEKCVNECTEFYDPNKKDTFRITIKNKSDVEIKMRTLDDTGNAQRMNDVFGDSLRYNFTDKRWMYYTDGKWQYDDKGNVFSAADVILERMKKETAVWAGYEGGSMVTDFEKHKKKTRSHNSKTNMIKEFQHLVPISPSELDTNKTLVNCPDSVINLENGEISRHSPDFYMTRMLGTSMPENPRKPEKWLTFLDDIFNRDKELIRYVQKALGYCLSGLTTEQCVFFLYGTGRNGKSTFLEVVRLILGDYATNIQPESIMMKSSNSSANTDIARLKGARLVTSVEPNEGMRLNEGLVKQLTGDDMITARKLYGDEFEYRPEFKLWMATNHKPTIRGTDLGIWRRIHIIPFTVTIPEDKVDKNLGDKLSEELPDILAWIVEGYRLWTAEGLTKPKIVEDAVKEYQNEMDVISAFLSSDFCVDGGEAKASALYAVYCQWATDNNEYKMPSRKFGVEMSKRYNKVHKKNGWYYQDVSLSGVTINNG